MKILITGGAGFIGSHLAERLISENHEVTIIDDLSTGSHENLNEISKTGSYTFVQDSILNYDMMSILISNTDYIFHLAASVGVKKIMEDNLNSIITNLDGTKNVLEIATKYKKPVLIASTSEIYGKNPNVLCEESDRVLGSTTKHRWSYACSKTMDEFLALAFKKQYGLNVTIARFFNTVGPRQTGEYGMVIPRFIESALNNEDIIVHGNGFQSRCFSHVNDTVEYLIRLMNNNGKIIYNVGNPYNNITINDLAIMIKEQSNSKSNIKYVSHKEVYGDGFEDMFQRIPSIERIEKDANYTPEFGLDLIIEDIIKYYESR